MGEETRVESNSASSLVDSQKSSLFDQIAGKNVEIGALKNQVYQLRRNLENQVRVGLMLQFWAEILRMQDLLQRWTMNSENH